jgi:hypothetical protein
MQVAPNPNAMDGFVFTTLGAPAPKPIYQE